MVRKITKKLKQINKSKKINKKNQSIQDGGRYLGQGSYGCVVTPALPCDKRTKSNKETKGKVSKIILKSSETIDDEINISKKIKNLDKTGRYFVTFDDSCPLKTIPPERSNVASSRYLNNSNESRHVVLDRRKKLDVKYCPVDLTENPINIIMPYGGIDMYELINNSEQTKFKIILKKAIIQNIKSCFMNLVEGLYILHSNNVVLRDIKEENIIANLIHKTNSRDISLDVRNIGQYSATLKYIDFGLSEHLTKSFTSNMENIYRAGTETFIPPEIFITNDLNYYIKNEPQNIDEYFVFENVYSFLKQNTRDYLLALYEYETVKDFKQKIINLYNQIFKEFQNETTILNKYFGRNKMKYDGYLQKADIYALGLTIYEFLISCNVQIKNNRLLYDLLINMLNLDPNNRYNVIQCLKHPYFTR